MELGDLPLETRAAAALLVILEDAQLGIRHRRDVLAAALWPTAATIPKGSPPPLDSDPHELSREEVRARAVAAYIAGEGSLAKVAERFGIPAPTLKSWVNPPARRRQPAPPPEGASDQEHALAAFRAGATVSELAERYEQPWLVVNEWIRGRG